MPELQEPGTDRLLCRAHDEPQYEDWVVCVTDNVLRYHCRFELHFDCGMTLYHTVTSYELMEMAGARWREYEAAMRDYGRDSARAAALLVLRAWERFVPDEYIGVAS